MADKQHIEIMAPAGNFECLMAAIQGGADSVYFGVGNLNMRSHSANNFTNEDLKEVVRICKEHGVKTYLTLNIVVYQTEMEEVRKALQAARDAGISAVIASDMAVIQMARQLGIEIHISTQMNISNFEAAKFYAQFADVIVLARELTLPQIADISRKIREENVCGPSGQLLRLELFVHGALCMSISGKCYLSLQEYNASANRGSCYQLCRRGYRVTDLETGRELDIENKYIMSPKDLCTIEFVDKIIEAGISVFKIEGRARSAEYVKIVTSAYRQAADACQDTPASESAANDASEATRKTSASVSSTNAASSNANGSVSRTIAAECNANGSASRTIAAECNANGSASRTNAAKCNANESANKTIAAECNANGSANKTNAAENNANGSANKTNAAEFNANGSANASAVMGRFTPELKSQLKERLSGVFNRGFWDGYYLGARLGEWSEVYGNKAARKKVYAAKVTNYFSKLGVAEILVEAGEINVGDEILIIGPSTGCIEHKVAEIRVDLKPVPKAVKGDLCSIPIAEKLRRSDKLYIWQPA